MGEYQAHLLWKFTESYLKNQNNLNSKEKKFFGMLRAQQQNEIFHRELCAEDQY